MSDEIINPMLAAILCECLKLLYDHFDALDSQSESL